MYTNTPIYRFLKRFMANCPQLIIPMLQQILVILSQHRTFPARFRDGVVGQRQFGVLKH